MAGAKDPAKNQVQSVAKAFAVLRAFDATLPELTISEVAARAGLDRGTGFRLLHTLCALGYVAEVPGTRRFRLTLKCLELGYAVLARGDLKAQAGPLLREIVPEIADSASLGMLDGADVVYVERIQGDYSSATVDRRVGSRTGAYAAALGHAILAFLPVEQQLAALTAAERVKLSENTVVELDALLERLALVRARGFAVSDGENAYGLRTVAAPVLGTDGLPIAGISLTIRSGRQDMDGFVALARPHALRIAAALAEAARLLFDRTTPPAQPAARRR